MRPFERIYDVVSKIPKGKVMTYKQVAELAGISNARIVGFAMHGNKDTKKVPCHRVVSVDGSLRGYAKGLKMKKELLQKEGIKFEGDKITNLQNTIFRLQAF